MNGGAGDTILMESLGRSKPVVFLVWMHEPGTTYRELVSVHADEDHAQDYADTLSGMDDEHFYRVDQEWLNGPIEMLIRTINRMDDRSAAAS